MSKSSSEFASFSLAPELLEVLQELKFTVATPIQAASLPLLLSGKDLVGQSKTGSGKTIAFALPMLQKLDLSDVQTLQGLVLCPTRELCQQVTREIRKLGRKYPSLKVVSLVGGEPIRDQLGSLQRGAHIAVGTPGRVLDHLRRRSLDLSGIRMLVLDEADRMLDMGFEEDMESILSETPEHRQTLFFSATFPDSIKSMSERYQKQPEFVKIESEPEMRPAIRELVFTVDADDKYDLLLWCLEEHKPESAIVFCNLKVTVAGLHEALEQQGVSAICLHGDLEQSERDRVMAKFRNASARVLIATDVAARGIDVADLDLVVNFDMPKPDIYVHRIGRTGRAGKSGVAISFIEGKEQYKIRAVEEATGTKIEIATNPDFSKLGEITPQLEQEAKMVTLFISGGRKEKVRPGDILGALTGEAGGLDGKMVGKIEIHDRFSYVAVAREVSKIALQRLQDGRIKGRKFRVEFVR